MTLSAPIYVLKQQAKALARKENIPLHQAQDKLAQREGFASWSLLAAKTTKEKPAATLFSQLRPGALVLLGSRPGQGKTLVSLDLALQTIRRGGFAAFFTLDFTRADVAAALQTLQARPQDLDGRLLIDDSDRLCADYLVAQLGAVVPGTLIIVDYLQLLDQRRENPELHVQVQQLKDFAQERQVVVVCLSQIDRSFDPLR